MAVNSQTTTFAGSYANHWLILRYCGHRIKTAADVLQKGAPNDHCWTNLTAELQLLNHIYVFGMLNRLFMQLPQATRGVLTLVTNSNNFTNNLQIFVPQLPVDNDDTNLSFDADRVDMVWWTAESAPLANDYYLMPFEELWRKATVAHRADDLFTITDTGTEEQVIDAFQQSLTDVFQKLKVEQDDVELEMAVVNE
ncbi:hypothetical protein JVU11DRAFT_10078 [Chiua virens]|nr:hypothetical protein JVU11DRAFT_10078 [Chiua virens]